MVYIHTRCQKESEEVFLIRLRKFRSNHISPHHVYVNHHINHHVHVAQLKNLIHFHITMSKAKNINAKWVHDKTKDKNKEGTLYMTWFIKH